MAFIRLNENPYGLDVQPKSRLHWVTIKTLHRAISTESMLNKMIRW